MKCTILHESRGRLRVHAEAVRMTLHRADVLEAYLNHSSLVEHATVYERTGDVVITYTGKRTEVIALLAHYLDEKFDTHHLDRLTALPSGEYYVDMAVAWAFSVALVKHFEQTLPYFTQRRLDRRVHNKALQKGRESLRIDDARKTILQRLKY